MAETTPDGSSHDHDQPGSLDAHLWLLPAMRG